MIVQAHCDNSTLLYILGLATLFLGLPQIKFLAELTEQADMDHFSYIPQEPTRLHILKQLKIN